MPQKISYGVRTDIGKVRTTNQDAVFSLLTCCDSFSKHPAFGIFIVADGVGGALACQIIPAYIQKKLLPALLTGKTTENIPDLIHEAFQQANTSLLAETPDSETTAAAAVVVGSTVYLGSVGDTGAFLVSNERCEGLTCIHNLQRDAPSYPALGTDNFIPDTMVIHLKRHERLLLCSDGLWKLVPEAAIQHTVTRASTPQFACDALVNLANTNGGSDNISVIIVKVDEEAG